jgi:hypothetical protein
VGQVWIAHQTDPADQTYQTDQTYVPCSGRRNAMYSPE